MYVILCYLGLSILARYIYKFPQIQEAVQARASENLETMLEDVGFFEGRVYEDLLPDTMLVLAIILIKRQRASYRNQVEAETARADGAVVFETPRWVAVLWSWAADQSKYGDLLAVVTMFAVATSRISGVHALYFLVGCLVCWLGTLPVVLWWTIYWGSAAHLIGMYVFQFQTVNALPWVSCDASGPEPVPSLQCCPQWLGFGPRLEGPGFYWQLLQPILAMLALDLHTRLHANLARRNDPTAAVWDAVASGAPPEDAEASKSVTPVGKLGSLTEPAVVPELEPAPERVAEPQAEGGSGSDVLALTDISCCHGSLAQLNIVVLECLTFFTTNVTLEHLGLETVYVVLLIAVVADANIVSLVYTLLIFVCTVVDHPRSRVVWTTFSVLSGFILFFRYFVYLGFPPCQSEYQLPFEELPQEYQRWFGVSNQCLQYARDPDVAEIVDYCAARGFFGDIAVLFITSAFARVCRSSGHRGAGVSHTHQEEITGPSPEQSLIIPHLPGNTWPSYIYRIFWKGGGITLLSLVLLMVTYWHQNLLLLGYLFVGLSIFLRDGSLVDTPLASNDGHLDNTGLPGSSTSLPIRLLMGFSGLSLLVQTAFQCPYFPENTDPWSAQRIIGLHKTSERVSDLVIATVAFLLSMSLVAIVRSQLYREFSVKVSKFETAVLGPERRRVAEAFTTHERDEHTLRLEEEKDRLRAQKDALLMAFSQAEPTLPQRDYSLADQSEGAIDPDEDPTLPTGPATGLDVYTTLMYWLVSQSDHLLQVGAVEPPEIHDTLRDSAGTFARAEWHKLSSLTQFRIAVKAVLFSEKIVGAAGSPVSLVIIRAVADALFCRSLEICCVFLCLNFIVHVDVVSCAFPLSLFGYCLLTEQLAGVRLYWKAAIFVISVRIVMVKCVNAWPTEDAAGNTLAEFEWAEGLLDVRPENQIWDLLALAGLLLRRHHMQLRGEWAETVDEQANGFGRSLRHLPLFGRLVMGSQPHAKELARLSLLELARRAAEVGIGRERVAEAEASAEPRAALIGLLVGSVRALPGRLSGLSVS
jgi:hypothetical protein